MLPSLIPLYLRELTRSLPLLPKQVLNLIPEQWPLQPMSSFLTRSIRRTLHDKHEGQSSSSLFPLFVPSLNSPSLTRRLPRLYSLFAVLKALSTSENLATMDLAFEVLRSLPPIVKTSPSSSDDGHHHEEGEKGSLVEILAEKIGHAEEEGRGVTVDFGLGGREGKERLTISPSGYGSDEDGEGGLA